MLKNYFKLAIKVLGRHKFFTFISLFGISFTLMVLMIATAFFQSELGGNAPLSKKDQMIFTPMVTLSREYQDTSLIIDTSYIDNVVQIDTTYTYKSAGRSMSRSSPSYFFLKEHLSDIPFVEKTSLYQKDSSFDIFINGKKLNFSGVYCDANFWDIYDFKFIEGNRFGISQVDNQAQVAILSRQASLNYFGDITGTIGKEIILDGKHFEVIGLVESGITSLPEVNAEVYIPLTHVNAKALKGPGYLGSFNSVYLASNRTNALKAKNEINQKEKRIPMPSDNNGQYDKLNIEVMTFMERYASSVAPTEDPEYNLKIFFGIISFFTILFFLLPTLNLINLNVSRIMERSSEIGVRKAFGANSQTILFQFVFENIILTLIGGIIGFVLALVIIKVINNSQILEDTVLSFNFQVFFYSLLICLFFGIISGLIPAWRMSRVHIVNALKQNQL
jgi:putative ABC transport system permease protein